MDKTEKGYYIKSFLVATVMAVILFLPFVIIDGGFFLYYADYNFISMPFYQHCVEAIHNGMVRWDWQTDLGANFVGSYSYYTLGNPFFWIMTLFPSSAARYLIAPLLCVKFGLISLFGFMYIRRFTKTPQTALIGGLLYTFSSFNLYSLVFMFQDAYLWFPLMLIALDETVLNKRKGIFALTVALNCLVNYFFFVNEVVFIVLYFFCRLAVDKKFRISAGGFLCLAFESVVGVMIAGVLFIPSIYQTLDIPRATETLSEWEYVFYDTPDFYGLLLESIFFPGEIALHSNMFEITSEIQTATWTNAAAYLPLFSIAGIVAYIKSCKKGHWIRFLIPICLLIFFVPGLSGFFTMFNKNAYSRWLFIPILICCMATACALEHDEYDWDFGYKVCEIGVFIISMLVLFVPFKQILIDENGNDKSFLLPRFLVGRIGIPTGAQMGIKLIANIGLAWAFLIALRYMLKQRHKLAKEVYIRRITAVSIVCCLLLGYYFIWLGRDKGIPADEYNAEICKDFEIDDDEFYRAEFAETYLYNTNMLWGESSFECLHNVVPGSIWEIQELLGGYRTEGTGIHSYVTKEHYAFRALTRVKYFEYKNSMVDAVTRDFLANQQEYFRPLGSQGDSELFISDYALPMGFAYDEYYLLDDIPEECRVDNLMVGAVLLTKEQAAEYSDILEKSEDSRAQELIKNDEYNEDEDDEARVFEIFKSDAARRTELGVSDFEINKKGFTAKCDYDKDRLVMFSVPYCKGWSAFVNGKPVEVDKVNGGFCAIRVPSGASDISFEYLAPGLIYGGISTAMGIAAYGAYILILWLIGRNKAKKTTSDESVSAEEVSARMQEPENADTDPSDTETDKE